MSGDTPLASMLGHSRTELEADANACLTPEGMVIEATKLDVEQRLNMSLIDASQLERLCPKANHGLLESLARAMTAYFPEFAITTPLRICHFMAQAAEESMEFRSLTEIKSKYASSKSKYKGRGIFQLTGSKNYRTYGKLVQVPLEDYPELAAMPQLSVLIACHYWNTNKINKPADKDDVATVTKLINGPQMLGLSVRKRYLAVAKTIWMSRQ